MLAVLHLVTNALFLHTAVNANKDPLSIVDVDLNFLLSLVTSYCGSSCIH